jgi:hypothetical protein
MEGPREIARPSRLSATARRALAAGNFNVRNLRRTRHLRRFSSGHTTAVRTVHYCAGSVAHAAPLPGERC